MKALALFPLFLSAATASALTPDSGLPGAYLGFAGGARAAAMGRAHTAAAEGADAVIWNPAALGYLRPNSLSFSHKATAEEASLDTLLYAQPFFRWGGFGVGYTRFTSGSLPVTDSMNRRLGSFEDLQQSFLLAYGLRLYSAHSPGRLLQSLAAGAGFKLSRQALYDVSASGWGMDAGLLARLKWNLSAGVSVRNLVQPKLGYEGGTDVFPRAVSAGLAANLLKNSLLLAADAEQTLGVGQSLRWSLGLEGLLWKTLRLRTGYDMKHREFTAGLGYAFGRHEASYSAGSNDAGTSGEMGLTYAFGGFPVSIAASPKSFSPVGLKKHTVFSVAVVHPQRIYNWALEIRNQDGGVVRSFRGSGPPPKELTWDGTTQKGIMCAAGNYFYTMQVSDAEGQKETTQSQMVTIEYGTPLDMMELRSRN